MLIGSLLLNEEASISVPNNKLEQAQNQNVSLNLKVVRSFYKQRVSVALLATSVRDLYFEVCCRR